ncbi:MAG TPA: hypothetical protein VLE95_09170 [Chlamydiales bacterium]|nr:hypothetical protein [Chlamydiales bacterium]
MAITWIAFAAFPPTAPLAAGIAVIAFTIAVVSIVMTTPDSEADLLSDNIQKIFKKIVSKPSEPLAHEQYFLPLAEQQAPLPVAEQQAPLPVAEDPRIYLAAPRYKDPIRKEFQPKQITSLRLLGDLHDHRR